MRGGKRRQMPPAASLYLHVLQAGQQRLVGLTHLLLVPPGISQGLLHLLLFSLRMADRLGAAGVMAAHPACLTSSCFARCSKSLSVVLSSWTA